jgi:hypothetical protein
VVSKLRVIPTAVASDNFSSAVIGIVTPKNYSFSIDVMEEVPNPYFPISKINNVYFH